MTHASEAHLAWAQDRHDTVTGPLGALALVVQAWSSPGEPAVDEALAREAFALAAAKLPISTAFVTRMVG